MFQLIVSEPSEENLTYVDIGVHYKNTLMSIIWYINVHHMYTLKPVP